MTTDADPYWFLSFYKDQSDFQNDLDSERLETGKIQTFYLDGMIHNLSSIDAYLI